MDERRMFEHHAGFIYCTTDTRMKGNINEGEKTVYEGVCKREGHNERLQGESQCDRLNTRARASLLLVIVLTCLSTYECN